MTLAKATGNTTGGNVGKTAPERRRPRGFLAAAHCARRTVGEAAAQRGFAVPDVLTRWGEIVGDHLAGLCLPVKVSYARDRQLGATLIVHVEGPRATEVEHLAPRILERVNQFYGYRAIARVRLTQVSAPATAPAAAPAAGFAEPARAFAPPPASPGPAEERRAAELVRDIEDDALRAALTRMGAQILARSR
ncbi:MAG TPA: DciA family protein [Thermohalobaculum sp.]|nr:DciA family protein [Thermohalobaculum sp.]